jgi:hypothetical protein
MTRPLAAAHSNGAGIAAQQFQRVSQAANALLLR